MANGMRPVQRTRLYEEVARQVAQWAIEEDLTDGDRLPPERELASRLGVSRATVSQALVAMEVVGAVEVRHGDGVIIRSSQRFSHLAEDIRAHTARLPDVLDARQALETKLAELAARRRSPEDMVALDDALAVMSDEVAAGDRGVRGDALFHTAVTCAARSELIAQLMSQLQDRIEESRLESLGQSGRPVQSLEQHRRIAEAIRMGDPELAGAMMRAHLDSVARVAILQDSGIAP